MNMVVNGYGVEIDFEQAITLMDYDIMSKIEIDGFVDSDQEYFNLYCKAHEEKFGEPFELAKENPCY